MREWWRVNLEDPLSKIYPNWDSAFLNLWTCIMAVTLLRGGR